METYDVIVAGGGSAGVAAAVGAARSGARTLLIERGPCLGGAATLRNVLTYCGIYTREDPPRQVVFGVAEEVLAGLRARSAVTGPVRFTAVTVVFDPESVKVVLDGLCERANVDVLLHTRLVAARTEGDRVTAVTIADHRGLRTVAGRAFVDATGEGDLASFAGAATRYGNDGQVQNGSLGVRIGGIPADSIVTRETVRQAIHDARQRGIGPLVSEFGLVARLPVSGDIVTYLVDEAYNVLDAREASRAEARARAQAAAYLEAVRLLPGCGGAYIVATGPELGTRESRHVTARHRLSVDEIVAGTRFPDAVAVGAWPVEFHPGPGIRPEWRFIADDGCYDIPLRSLLSVDRANLLAAGRNLDGDRLAGSSLRAMGTAFATGHAAGIAASVAAATGASPDPEAVRAELSRQDARLPSFPFAVQDRVIP